MADNKVIFVAFAIEDERIRDLIKGQSEIEPEIDFERWPGTTC